jgi:hypothetical protein
MGRPRPTPSSAAIIDAILRRLAVVERRSRDVLTPAQIGAAVTNTSTTFLSTHTALANPVGPNITWWVKITLTGGATSAELRLTDSVGNLSPVVTATAAGVYAVTLPVADDWAVGVDRLVDIQSRVLPSGTVTVLPVRALVA